MAKSRKYSVRRVLSLCLAALTLCLSALVPMTGCARKITFQNVDTTTLLCADYSLFAADYNKASVRCQANRQELKFF